MPIQSVARDLFSTPFACLAGLAVGKCVYLSAGNTVAVADGNDVAKMPCIGIVVEKPTTITCIVQHGGECDAVAGLTAGQTYYVNASGNLVNSPAGLAVPQALGFARDADTLVMFGLVAGGDGGGSDAWPALFDDLRVWDAFATLLPATPLTDNLGLVTNTWLTTAPTVETEDLKTAGLTTSFCRFQFAVPDNYVAAGPVTLRLFAGMKTTVADVTATIDAEVVRTAAPSVDICSTGAQSINSLTPANKDFVLTPTAIVPGDILDVRIAIAVNDAASITVVIGQLQHITMLLTNNG
jgi:hypothetical protein